MIKVLVVGQYNNLVHWTKNTVEAFAQSDCDVDYFALDGGTAIQSLHLRLFKAMHGDKSSAICIGLEKKLKKYRPDLIVFIVLSGLQIPEKMFAITNDVCPNAKKIAWIGDKLTLEETVFARYVDWIFCTDTTFINDVHVFGFTTPTSYLPLAVNQNFFKPMSIPRTNKIIYVAKSSPSRERILCSMQKPITLYDKSWSSLKDSQHEINAYRLPYKKLPEIYATCRAVLNIKNEKNVVNGLNQRSFEPYGCMTPVLNDAVQDVEKCFEVGKEILVYHSLDEFYDLYDRLSNDSHFAQSIGRAGYKRIMAEHTYAHRVHTMLIQIGLK